MAKKPKFDPSKPFEVAKSTLRESGTLMDAAPSGAGDAKPKFDPSKPFEPAPDEPQDWRDTQLPMGTTPRGLIQGGLDALPFAGMLGGGAIGGAGTLGLGAIAGAGLGAGAGEAAKNLGEKYLLGKDKTREEIYGDPARAILEGGVGEMGGQAIGGALASKGGKWAIGKLGKVGSKLSSTFTGVPQKEIETYAKNVPEINKMAAAADYDPQELADVARGKINDVLKNTRGTQSEKIKSALASASKDKNINVTSVVDALEQYKQRLNPSLHPEAIKDVDELIGRITGAVKTKGNSVTGYLAPNEKMAVQSLAAQPSKSLLPNTTELMDEVPKKYLQRLKGKTSIDVTPVIEPRIQPGQPGWNAAAEPETSLKGWVAGDAGDKTITLPTQGRPEHFANAQTLQDVVKFLQDQASPAYGKSPVGFNIGDAASGAAKSGAASARKIMQESGPKAVSEANDVLSRLHDIEDVMNKSMLTEGKTGAPLYAAGSGANGANAKVLKELGKLTDTDLLGEVEKIAAARQFGKPSLLPVDATGKSLTRMGVAGGLGYLVGHVPGAVVAEGLASPAALKAAINTGHAVAPTIKNPELQALIIQEYLRRQRGGLVKQGLIKDAAPGMLTDKDAP